MKIAQIGIIGAGASGMMAAVTAAGLGQETILLEKKDRIGKKILATGNGRCNLSNLSFSNTDYNSASPALLEQYFKQFGVEDTIRFFNGRGMLVTDKNGYLYPRTLQAATVLDVFRQQLEGRAGLHIATGCMITSIKRKKDGFSLETDQGGCRVKRLILACGTPAGEKKGEGGDGYQFAQSFGHTLVKPVPALVQLRCQESFFKALTGVRSEGTVRLIVNGKTVRTEWGELQLTDYGISGIPVFQLSRFASYALAEGKKVEAEIDFLPEFEEREEDWNRFVNWKIDVMSKRSAEEFFTGTIHKKLVQVCMKITGVKPSEPCPAGKAREIFKLMRCFPVHIAQTNPVENAQACAGGVPLTQVDGHLQSKLVPGLYFTGELLDVDGRCGGYNLQWAWTSGYIAGKHAVTAI